MRPKLRSESMEPRQMKSSVERDEPMREHPKWCVTRRWFCTLYGEVGLKGYAELACKITFCKKETNNNIDVQNNVLVTLQRGRVVDFTVVADDAEGEYGEHRGETMDAEGEYGEHR